jgi:hypothetical protein
LLTWRFEQQGAKHWSTEWPFGLLLPERPPFFTSGCIGETTPLRHLMQEEGTGTKVFFITKTLKRKSLSTKFLSYIKFKPMWIRKCPLLFQWKKNKKVRVFYIFSQNYKGWVPFFTFYFLFHMIQYRTW